jgi:hypothetical protein
MSSTLYASNEASNLANFIRFLGDGRWMSREAAADIMQLNFRDLRKLATASRGKIGSGPDGYKLVSKMTPEEFDTFTRRLQHQADEMLQRVSDSTTVFHGGFPARASAPPGTAGIPAGELQHRHD